MVLDWKKKKKKTVEENVLPFLGTAVFLCQCQAPPGFKSLQLAGTSSLLRREMCRFMPEDIFTPARHWTHMFEKEFSVVTTGKYLLTLADQWLHAEAHVYIFMAKLLKEAPSPCFAVQIRQIYTFICTYSSQQITQIRAVYK